MSIYTCIYGTFQVETFSLLKNRGHVMYVYELIHINLLAEWLQSSNQLPLTAIGLNPAGVACGRMVALPGLLPVPEVLLGGPPGGGLPLPMTAGESPYI